MLSGLAIGILVGILLSFLEALSDSTKIRAASLGATTAILALAFFHQTSAIFTREITKLMMDIPVEEDHLREMIRSINSHTGE
jgi:MFS superfamily sulfate permease-like transporter